MSFYACESLPFSEITLSAISASTELKQTITVRQVNVTPELPEGMTVDFVTAYLVELVAKSPIHDFAFDCRAVSCPSKGNRESGEHLDAQSWDFGEGLLMIGTEDGEMLQSRMSWVRIDHNNYPVSYLDDGFRITVPYVPARQQLDFHFVVAYNKVDCNSDSEWFAVDIRHSALRSLPATTIKDAS